MLDNHRYQLKYFDPLDGELPDPFAVMFVEEITRARKILTGLTKKQIISIALAINTLIRDKNFIDPSREDRKGTPVKVPMFGQIFDVLPTTNHIEAIYKNINNVALTDHISIPNIAWEHVFATLAIFYAELIANYLFARKNWNPDFIFPQITIEEITDKAKEFMQEARQAITFAEILFNQPKMLQEFKSKNARAAAKKRYAPDLDPFKNLIIQEYESKFTKKSNREAAKCILDSLSKQGLIEIDSRTFHVTFNEKVVLRSDDPEQRIAIWIGNYKRGN